MIWHTHEWKVATNWWNGNCVRWWIASLPPRPICYLSPNTCTNSKCNQFPSVATERKKSLGKLYIYSNIHIPVSIERELLNEIKFHLLLDRFFFPNIFAVRCSLFGWMMLSGFVYCISIALIGCLIRVCHSMIFASHAFSLWRIFHLCQIFIYFSSSSPAHGPTDWIQYTRFG